MVRITGRIMSCAALALLLVANASPASPQGTKMSDVADQLRAALAGVSVNGDTAGPRDAYFERGLYVPVGGLGVKPGSPGAR